MIVQLDSVYVHPDKPGALQATLVLQSHLVVLRIMAAVNALLSKLELPGVLCPTLVITFPLTALFLIIVKLVNAFA